MLDDATSQTTEMDTTADMALVPDYKADADKWKAMSRKWEGTAKENADAARRLAEIEEAQKTEAQRAADRAAELESRSTRAEMEAARLRVALRVGLTEVQARRLIGDSEEALEADALELLASFNRPEPEPIEADTAPVRPKEKLKSGSTPATPDDVPQLTREQLKGMSPEAIVKAKEEGQLNRLLGIT